MVYRQFGCSIEIVMSDNGTEFYCLKEYLMKMTLSFKLRVVTRLNKMGVLKENINTF